MPIRETRRRKLSWKESEKKIRGEKIIRLPIDEKEYAQNIGQKAWFHTWLASHVDQHSPLFPVSIKEGYHLHDMRQSKKLGLFYRRIRIKATHEVYTIQPAFCMPYLSGKTSDCQKGLLLLSLGTPLGAVVECFGENQMKWLRRYNHLGRFNLVATTVGSPDKLPRELVSDEKITFWSGKEIYGCITVAKECILGAQLSLSEDEKGLQQAYGVFKREALALNSAYCPLSVNGDGWSASKKAWLSLFEGIGFILCFLHGVIKIRQVSKKEPLRKALFDKVWNAYRATDKECFLSALALLGEWAGENISVESVKIQVGKLVNKGAEYACYYQTKGYRTSNMVDRAIKRIDDFLQARQYFHGHFACAQMSLRATALCYNFAPFCSRTRQTRQHLACRAADLNGFVFSQHCWLQNLLIAASRNGTKTFHQLR